MAPFTAGVALLCQVLTKLARILKTFLTLCFQSKYITIAIKKESPKTTLTATTFASSVENGSLVKYFDTVFRHARQVLLPRVVISHIQA